MAIERLTVGSYVGYSPNGKSEVSRQSRDTCFAVKLVREDEFSRFIRWVANEITNNGLFSEIFDKESILVPVPRSAPLQKDGLWPSESVANKLLEHGVGKVVQPMLRRSVAVTKSATASKGNRPTPKMHEASMALDIDLSVEGNIVLIDDVLTLGATMLGAKLKFAAAAPWLEVQGFAPIRTMGLQPEVHTLIDPWISEVYGNEEWANRSEKRFVGKAQS